MHLNLAKEPYDAKTDVSGIIIHKQSCKEIAPRVSAASITPSLYTIPTTEVPVTYGSLYAIKTA